MLKKVPCVTLIFSIFLFLLLFCNVNLASAQSSEGAQDCANKQVPSTLEFLRLGLTPSLKDSEGGIPNPYSLIPSPSSKCSDSGQNESSVESDSQLSAKRVGQRAMYRLYNQWTGEHFYTCSEEERDEIAKVGWTKEDIGWVAPKESSVPVYRLYNKYIPGGDHHYTPNADERDNLVKVGWIYEGIGWYSADEGSLFRAPVYRQYNPYADTGTHNYTLSTSERDNLIKAGWKDEGVGYYGLDQSQMSAIDFNNGDIKVTTDSKVYNGKAQTQTITSTNLKENEDYVVEYSNNKNVGTATITITGINGFYGEKVYTFKITQKTISQVKWGDLEFGYDGKAHVPTATAVGLCSGDSATITVTASGNHTATGTYTATATAISNKNYKLASNIKTDFRIGTKIDFDNKNKPTVDTSDEVYTGSAITKEVSVAGLTKDKDYTVTYKDNINVGTATVTIKGIGGYFGEKSYTFKITQASLTGASITAETLTYNGSEQAAKISKVTVDGRNLEEGTDFKVVSGNKGIVASTYGDLTIEGIGNYKDNATGSWTITPKTVGIDWSNTSITYDGTPKAPSATVTGVCGSDSVKATVAVTEEEHTNAGEYNATVTELNNANYQLPTPNPTTLFKIVAKEVTDKDLVNVKLALPETDYVYDKTPKEPAVDGIPAKFVDYSISYADNVNAGEDTAKVIVTFGGNYQGEKVLTFSIAKAEITVDWENTTSLIYNGSPQKPTARVKTGAQGDDTINLSVSGEQRNANADDEKTYTAKAFLDEASEVNYTISENEETSFTISPKVVTITWDSEGETSFTYDGTPKTPTAIITGTVERESLTAMLAYEDSSSVTLTGAPSVLGTYTTTVTGLTAATTGTTASNYALPETVTTKSFTIGTGNYWFAQSNADDPVGTIYKGQDRIDEDITQIREEIADGSFVNEASTYAEYETLMANEDYHLYTKWNTATDERADAAITGKNEYVEFRIIQVGAHDTDDSAVTFMATHSLPTSKMMSSSSTNLGGWASSTMRTSVFAEDGYVQTGLSDLANADTVKPVNKTTAYRATDTEEWSTDVTNSITSDKFWLLSLSEVFGTATDGNKLISGETQYFKNEGSRYAWFTKGNVNAMSGIGTKNTIIAENFLTREGKKPVGYSSYSWWLRTPCVNVNLDKDFGAAGVDGGPFAYSMSNYSSVVPCFAF